jgi:hypothetical protein
MESNIIEKAKAYSGYGLSVIPTRSDKSPVSKWTTYQKRRMVNGEIEQSFTIPNTAGIGIVCGQVSGGLEVIDIDCKYDHTGRLAKDFFTMIKDNTDVFENLLITSTKNSGWHIYYRCQKVDGNKKFATNSQGEVLIETRGEGGYVIAPPSPGYSLKKGNYSAIPVITTEERDILHSIARTFGESPISNEYNDYEESTGCSPFDDYNECGDALNMLLKHGWQEVKRQGDRIHLKRPGKSKNSVSGNWHISKRIFYPFTTSTQFEAGKGYNATMVYTLLECNGDYSEASHRLYNEGFGKRENIYNKPVKEIVVPKVPAFPMDSFPKFIQDFILKCHEVYRTPIDYWAGAVMAATGLAIGNKLELVTKYRNAPVFWICLVGDVSSGKTEAQNRCLKPFKIMDTESFEQYKIKEIEYERILNLNKSEKADEGITENPKPEYFQYLLNDYTHESLADVHSINRRGIMIERDELKGWFDDFNRYSKSGEQSNMISTWSGMPIKINRKTSGISLIDNPTILVMGGMQPDLLPTLTNDHRAENGFLARMCFFYPENTVKPKYSDERVPLDIQNEYSRFIRDMTRLPKKEELTLSNEAERIYQDWYNLNCDKTDKANSGYLKGVFGKLDIISLRTAILIKGMKSITEGDYDHEISGEIMQCALKITEYFRATALKVYHNIFSKRENEISDKAVANYLLQKGINKSEIARTLNVHRQQVQRWTK